MSKRKVTDFFAKKGQENISEPTPKKTNAVNISNFTDHTQLKDATPATSEATKQGNSVSAADEAFHPPKHFSFPKKKSGKRERSCQHSWFETYKWLHYDEMYVI